jgi:hypothetical protein
MPRSMGTEGAVSPDRNAHAMHAPDLFAREVRVAA